MPMRREPVHVGAHRCDEGDCRRLADPGQRLGQGHRVRERAQQPLDFALQLGQCAFEELDVGQQHPHQHQVHGAHPPLQHLAQLGQLGAQTATRQLRQRDRVLLPAQQRLQQRPTARP
jgi:hypothetical protein